ncbi:unnamed protein product [Orchesella dallaii]|uniref:Uncharacterized protein n=1 Tax=Orchesella dallaii TaxID=48710 RepID=A0ABP1QS17_9HEXA
MTQPWGIVGHPYGTVVDPFSITITSLKGSLKGVPGNFGVTVFARPPKTTLVLTVGLLLHYPSPLFWDKWGSCGTRGLDPNQQMPSWPPSHYGWHPQTAT